MSRNSDVRWQSPVLPVTLLRLPLEQQTRAFSLRAAIRDPQHRTSGPSASSELPLLRRRRLRATRENVMRPLTGSLTGSRQHPDCHRGPAGTSGPKPQARHSLILSTEKCDLPEASEAQSGPLWQPPTTAHPCASACFPAICNWNLQPPRLPPPFRVWLSIFSSHKPSLGINGPSSLQPPSAKFTKSLPADASFSRSWQWGWGRLGLPFRLQHTAPTGPASW